MILVTVGTHEDPFDRLVAAAADVRRELGERVVVQAGTSALRPEGCEVHGVIGPSALEELVREARIVVGHAGPATIELALAAGKVPIVVPRRPELGEHVDDHQVRYVEHLRGRVHVLDDPAGLAEAVRRHPDVERTLTVPVPADAARMASAFADVVDDVLSARRRHRSGIRATLGHLLRF